MIVIQDLVVQVGAFRLDGVSLEVPAGRYAALMGKTGSGKTTILECLCGLRPVESGKILLAGRDVTRLRPAERYRLRASGRGPVSDDDGAPAPGVPAAIRKWPARKMAERTAELAQLLGIEPLLDRRPMGLSGGESQRVALGRALSFQPSTLVLDEPLSALDEHRAARCTSCSARCGIAWA